MKKVVVVEEEEEEEEEEGKDKRTQRRNYIQSTREQINYDIVFRGAGDNTTTRAPQLNDGTTHTVYYYLYK